MRKILAILKLKLQLLRRNYAMFLMMTLSPLLFTFFMGSLNPDGMKNVFVYIDDQDKSAISGELLRSFDPQVYKIVPTTEKDILDKIKKKEINTGYIIPQGFGAHLLNSEPTTIEVVRRPEQTATQEIPTIMNSAALRIRSAHDTAKMITDAASTSGGPLSPAVQTQVQAEVKKLFDEGWQNPRVTSTLVQISDSTVYQTDMKAQASMGFLIFFLMFTLSFNITSILDDKTLGTWNRILSTPTKAREVLAGHFLGTMLIGCIQVILLVGFGALVMKVQWGRSPVGVFLILFALIFALTSLGLALAGFIQTRRSLQAIYPVLIVSTSMLGGCMWPLEIVPNFMKTVAYFIPQGQAMMGLTELIVRGGGLEKAILPVASLVGMGIIFFIFGTLRVRPQSGA